MHGSTLPATQGPSRWPFESTLALSHAILWCHIAPMLSLSTCTRPQCLGFRGCGSLRHTGQLDAGGNFGRGRYSVYGSAHSPTRCNHTCSHSDPCAAASQAHSHSITPFHIGKACLCLHWVSHPYWNGKSSHASSSSIPSTLIPIKTTCPE